MSKLALLLMCAAGLAFSAAGQQPNAAVSVPDRVSADCAGVSGYLQETLGSEDPQMTDRLTLQYEYWLGRYVSAYEVTQDEAIRAANEQVATFARSSMESSINRHGENGKQQAEDLAAATGRLFVRCEQIYALEQGNG